MMEENLMTGATRWPVAVVMAVALLVLPLANAALAKGPESVTISGPGGESVTIDNRAVTTAERDLITLFMEQSGLWFGLGDLPEPIPAPSSPPGDPVVITWLNVGPPGLDVTDRTIVQHLHLVDGGVLIETPPQEALVDWGQGVIGWFEAPPTFTATLAELGVDLPALAAASSDTGPNLSRAGYGAALVAALAAVALVSRRRSTAQPA